MNDTTDRPGYDAARHYARLFARAPRRLAFRGTTPADVAAWQAEFRPRLQEALGLSAMAEDLAGHRPTAEKLGAEALADFQRERWRLWVEPDVPLPFYLLRPRTGAGPWPLVLTPHGHNPPHRYAGIANSAEEQASLRDGDRDIAVQAVQAGYLALAPTTRGFGETRTAADAAQNRLSSCRTSLLHGLLVGRTAIGERVWDIARLLDWALTSLPVDPARIAITGNSGGGTVSLFAAACDPRLAVAVPSCYFCTFTGSIGTIFHCDCNYVPGILRLGEMDDVAGLTAPRPFLAIAGQADDIFPIGAVREAFARLQRVYAAAGVPDRCELYVGAGGHRYYQAGAWPFIAKHFHSDPNGDRR